MSVSLNKSLVYINITESTATSAEDALVGSLLLLYGIFGSVLYAVVDVGMYICAKEANGFIFLISMAIADHMCIFIYSIWTGIVILARINLPVYLRLYSDVVTDFIWFAMVNIF